jgi:hypothetical protein
MNERNKKYLEMLKHSFNENEFIDFIKDLLNLNSCDLNLNACENATNQKQFLDVIDNYKYIANYNDGLNHLGIFVIKLTDNTTTNSRNIQRNFVASLLTRYDLDASIVALYS